MLAGPSVERVCRRAAHVVTAAAATAASRQAESAVAAFKRDISRAESRVRFAHTVAARPCVVDARRDRWDDAASAVTPELKQPFCRRATRVMTAAAAIVESRRAESAVVAGRREVGRAE